jgi:phage/plasmid-like protein (TIGR03299 family)
MADEITLRDSMFAVGAPTWHGKEILREVVTWQEAFELSGIKTPILEPVYAQVNGVVREVKDRRAVTVPGVNEPLAIVSDRYNLLDPRHAFDTLDEIVKEGNAAYETAGTFRGQRVMWGLLKLTEEFKVLSGDDIRTYIFVTDFRDATGSARFGSINERVVCANTHAAALREGGLTRFRHTAGINERVEEAARILGVIRETTLKTVAQYRFLAEHDAPQDAASEFIKTLLPLPVDPKSADKVRIESFLNSRDNVVRDRVKIGELFMGAAKGADIAPGTYWNLFNAVTEFADHFRQPTASADSRLYSKTLGVANDLKAYAFDLALTNAKRG